MNIMFIIFLFLFVVGFLIQIYNFIKILSCFNILLDMNDIIHDFIERSNTCKDFCFNDEIYYLKQKLARYTFFYNNYMQKPIKTSWDKAPDPFIFFTLNNTSFQIETMINSVFNIVEYNINYYEELKSKYFWRIFNPLLYLDNAINAILSSLFETTETKLPSFLKNIISIVTSLFSLYQIYLILKGLL